MLGKLEKNQAIYVLNIIVCLFVFYVFSPYRKIYLSENSFDKFLFFLSLLITAFVAIFDCVTYRTSPYSSFAFLSTSAIVADIIMIVVDSVFFDPTSHNLAPFELIIFGFCSFLIFSFLFLVTKTVIFVGRFFK